MEIQMKPFKINRKSWHYKLNKHFFPGSPSKYYMEDSWEPKHNNFCSYWRATFFRIIFASIAAWWMGFILYSLAQAAWMYPLETAFYVFGSIFGIATIVIVVIGLLMLNDYLTYRKIEKLKKEPSLFMQKYLSHKQKICPMVEYD